MGRLLNSMVEVRVLAVLQIALVACVIAVPAPLGTEVEMLQVAPDIMAVDSMDAMISSAMKAEVKADIGDANQSDEEMNEEEAETLKKIAEKKAIAAQLAASQKRDCITTQWTAWSKCTKKCGSGEIGRKRTVTQHPANGGEACPTYEEAIQDELKKAIAKNTISTAMAGFETQSAAQQVVHQTARQQAVHAASARVVDNNLQPLVEQTAQPTAN